MRDNYPLLLAKVPFPQSSHLSRSREQHIQCPTIFNTPILENNDLISTAQRWTAMTHHQTGWPYRVVFAAGKEPFPHRALRFDVERAGKIVK